MKAWRYPGMAIPVCLLACDYDHAHGYDDAHSYEGELSHFDGTALPVIVMDTLCQEIPDEPKVSADLQIFVAGLGSLAEADARNADFGSRIGVEVRGATSQRFPKKQYGVELRDARGG